MRIGLIGDTHGWVPALEGAVAACRAAGVDVLVHCGDFLSSPFSPDPPGETIALLRAAGVRCVYGNGEAYLMDWGTPTWERTVATRLKRPDPPRPGFWDLVPAGQAELSAEGLAWLRSVPEELVLDAARPGDVYVCHGMPGNPFVSFWPASWPPEPIFNSVLPDEERLAALSRPEVANADLILCGHSVGPYVQPEWLPNGRRALVVRASGWPRQDDGVPRTSVAVLTHTAAGWEILLRPVPYVPRDPSWIWNQPSRRPV
jgi:hypothetical protein